MVEKDSVLVKNVSTTDIADARNQLWDILKPHIQYLEAEDREYVELAFTQMAIAHGEMQRKSGEYYIIHPVAATITLADIHLDKHTIAACLLHDVPEDTTVTFKDLAKEFSAETVMLIEGVTKFSTIKYKGEKRYAENLRKMFIAMSRDIRVVFIKLADRIHNLETLKHLRPDKQHRIALESLEIYAPIAERLGMSGIRGTIEDLAFPYVYPDEYKQLKQISSLEIIRRQKILERIIKQTRKILKEHDITIEGIDGRAKRYFSVYRKMIEKKRDIAQIYDLIALRVIASSVNDCYHILSLIQQNFETIDTHFKDYIAQPKINGYQSIHITAKFGATGDIFEFQIRTQDMNEFAEYGVATHWIYKQKGEGSILDFDPKQQKWISELVSLSKQRLFVKDEDYLRKVKINLYHDRIFVMTPKGDVVDLRNGSTALDFAFKVHEEVGRTAMMAKINNKPVTLGERLTNGDIIEIVTDRKQIPTWDWLSKVATPNAATKIRRILLLESAKNGDKVSVEKIIAHQKKTKKSRKLPKGKLPIV
jgi:GTP diphosphokinase / guanosine-3',5'-bis(diphosphate) 3'-diphosphatase